MSDPELERLFQSIADLAAKRPARDVPKPTQCGRFRLPDCTVHLDKRDWNCNLCRQQYEREWRAQKKANGIYTLDHLEKALACLQRRTLARIARGVEGTHEK